MTTTRPIMRIRLLIALLLMAIVSFNTEAQSAEKNRSPYFSDLEQIEKLPLPVVDLFHELLADEERAQHGRVAHFATGLEVDVDPWRFGTWEGTDNERARWLLRVKSPGALSLSLAITEFELPLGARLNVLATDGEVLAGPFTHADNDAHKQLWTPPLSTDDVVLSLELPFRKIDDLRFLLTRVHHGYAGFGVPSEKKSGPCQRDLVCAANGDWHGLGKAVGLISVEGVRYCTGFLINNTAQDQRPYFITAGHCGIDALSAPSVVVMWEHAVSKCDPSAEAPLPSRSFQTGATFRAGHKASDLVLIELDDTLNAEGGSFFAGWDRSHDDPKRAMTIHHPNTDRRRIAVSDSSVSTTDHLGAAEVQRGNHLRVQSWDLGATEGGSSGAPLFNEDLRVVGALHGGYAACGNKKSDWFGRLSAAWDDGNAPVRRLSDWLDPLSTGAVVLDGLSP